MAENKTYNILELQKMGVIELTSIADQFEVQIQNNFKQSLIYAILDRQADLNHKPSELHSRDRYAATAELDRQLKNNIPTCKKKGCNEPVYEWGLCFKHHCQSEHQ